VTAIIGVGRDIIRHEQADGEIGYISVRFFIVKDGHDRTIKTYGANQDITDRKQAEEELERYQKHLEGLVEEYTSDLREVVSAMAGREVHMAELKQVISASCGRNWRKPDWSRWQMIRCCKGILR
jgi:hypothetical protein